MLILNRIDIERFGPYKEVNTIEFPKDGGVTIVYGENMRGKTSLLNAFRYALFGKVLSRGSRVVSLHDMSNWESGVEGEFGFKVVLNFTHEGINYELTRQLIPRSGVKEPKGDYDYKEESFLRRDGNFLSPTEKDVVLGRVMPEQVSRFFLFDGELLQEYEDLLRDESDMGKKIKDAIERILGVPILQNARGDLKHLHQEAQKQESKAAQKDQKTRELGTHLEELNEQCSYHQSEINRLKVLLEELKGDKLGLEEELRRFERAESLLDERDRLDSEIKELSKKLEEKELRIKDVMSNIWRGSLSNKISEVREGLEGRIQEIKDRQTKMAVSKEIANNLMKAIQEGSCPTCYREVDTSTEMKLREAFESYNINDSEEDEDINSLIQMNAVLKSFQTNNSADLVNELSDSIEEYRIEIANKKDKIDEINESITGIDSKNIRTQRSDYEKNIKETTLTEDAIKEEEKILNEKLADIEKLERRLSQEGGADIQNERKRRELYGDLYNLFAEAVSVYRDNLRKKVEKDASELFVNLTSENEYVGLSINESYGLTIVHEDGEIIPIRSAGAEHIVALSLMGALQKNAPLQGPIIMDSPFGRLDDTHTTNVVASLPIMANQVALLVYERELKPQTARRILLGGLKKEYKLERISARHTKIVKRLEV
ncbi:AAA family ATPase [Mesobacillus jeotgali]|uniref:AAA family ATPase n=1 Tax=Mesobacillus jeotgali TaxID=129985 RepID=UPI002227FF81|nr:AAA family ATPase [Mesobacillus jeotgali]UYZ22027.1 AAA family ATPase [Mesobacillus jeotgali]